MALFKEEDLPNRKLIIVVGTGPPGFTVNEAFRKGYNLLAKWATDKKESNIVRVNSVQGLFNLLQLRREFYQDFNVTISEIRKENIPSLKARIKKLQHSSR